MESIARYVTEHDIQNYTIEVHALKSASRLIGATDLAKMAEKLEECGNSQDWDTIHNETNGLLTLYRSYLPILAPFGEKPRMEGKKKISPKDLYDLLVKLEVDMEELNLEDAEKICEELKKYHFDESEEAYLEKLATAIENIDFEIGNEAIVEWKTSIQNL